MVTSESCQWERSIIPGQPMRAQYWVRSWIMIVTRDTAQVTANETAVGTCVRQVNRGMNCHRALQTTLSVTSRVTVLCYQFIWSTWWDIYPEWGLVIVIMIVIIDNDGSLDILHHPGPGERPVSGLEERVGECWVRNAPWEMWEPGSILNLFNVKQRVDPGWLYRKCWVTFLETQQSSL